MGTSEMRAKATNSTAPSAPRQAIEEGDDRHPDHHPPYREPHARLPHGLGHRWNWKAPSILHLRRYLTSAESVLTESQGN
jgi:hypothetical protein